jgi:micrococcal nuclease
MRPPRRSQIRRIALLLVGLSLLPPLFYYFKNYPAFHHLSATESIPLNEKVLRVVDGDTIQLSNGEWVRYIGIDAPELRRKVGTRWVEDPQPGAREAYELNRRLVEGRQVRLEWDVERRDHFHRLLAYVFVGGLFVNAELVKAGYATVFTFPPNVRYHQLFLDLQEEATIERRGLWAGRMKQSGRPIIDASVG